MMGRRLKTSIANISSNWIEFNYQLRFWLIDQPAEDRGDRAGVQLTGHQETAELKIQLSDTIIKSTVKLSSADKGLPTSTFPMRKGMKGEFESYLKLFTITEKTKEGFFIKKLALSNPNVPLSILTLPFKMVTMENSKMLKFLEFIKSFLKDDLVIKDSTVAGSATIIQDRKTFNTFFKTCGLQSYNFIWSVLNTSTILPVEDKWKITYFESVITCINFILGLDTKFKTAKVDESVSDNPVK
jgi:hypothetical protein